MNLRVILPTHVEADRLVAKVTAEAAHGSFTLLPRHVDLVAGLVPGILSYESEDGEESFVALDGGTLVKCGEEVMVSTSRAVRGRELGELERTVAETFKEVDQRERAARNALARMEADFVRRFLELEEYA